MMFRFSKDVIVMVAEKPDLVLLEVFEHSRIPAIHGRKCY